ncbi:MAG: DUF6636 domain-containing protein [Longimicrobiaceae bacterium]
MSIRPALLALTVLATAAPGRFDAHPQLESFQTPSGNIACMADDMDEDGRWELRCDVGERDWRGPSARDCELDSGDAVGMRATGRPFWVCHGDTILRAGPVLGYGSTWRKGPFTCVVARAGVTCRNRSQHGFTVSRASYRLF